MNGPTADLLRDATRRLERAILERDCPAIAALQGDRKLLLSDYDYLRDQETARAFEDRAAAKAREINAVRVALVVRQVWLFATDTIYSRAVAKLPCARASRNSLPGPSSTSTTEWTTATSRTPAARAVPPSSTPTTP
ncbi:hypothetical protein DF268_11790 [Streptomyces sp. V2]|uniref:Uncharacterized protein n=1 Tax=Streptomyces niveiscabiei TaxID=164115 RepID=A0ABW9I577_9ACTN|nr:hypothetical protein [Streptomyces sp. V2]PWG13344.1 hypothetical protein DF268_11790 [Streptomyces sp. V2]